jgi:L-Ala-D/L-Glu epimerase / N-acetyl-D-glutamate racemase
MTTKPAGPIGLHTAIEEWPRVTPVRITGYTWDVVRVLVVRLEQDGCVGSAEAAGVYYHDDNPVSMQKQIESLRAEIAAGLDRTALGKLLPPGGARNALDCAMWDLEAKRARTPVWQLAGLRPPRALLTTFTCHADEPDKMAARAASYSGARAIKLKLTGQPVDADRVRAVRAALPDAWLGVDANQGFTRHFLERLLPVLVKSDVELIEQPFAIGEEALLDGFQSPIPIAADESVQSTEDVDSLQHRFDVVNIKLDKCGGLTEGLRMSRRVSELGMRCMVGNMGGTSLAMAPAFVLGQMCAVTDLDGPIFLRADRATAVSYEEGLLSIPPGLWGWPEQSGDTDEGGLP